METFLEFNGNKIARVTTHNSDFDLIDRLDKQFSMLRSKHTGLFYPSDTNPKIIQVIENAYTRKTRLVFDYGSIETGISWGETYDVSGTIGKSGGVIKIPLLIHNRRSLGGGALCFSIVGIRESKGKRVLYSHAQKVNKH